MDAHSMNHTHATKILIVDDEAAIREVLSAALRDDGYLVEVAPHAEKGIELIKSFQPQVVFLDIWMKNSTDGIDVLKQIRHHHPDIEFIMISGHGTIETAVKATKMGAWDFIEKPLSMDKISITLSNILHYRQERKEKEALLNKLRKSIALIGEAPPLILLKQQIVQISPSHAWVLIEGEKGSGRNLVAQNIHYMSSRASKIFVELNCSSIPEDNQHYELFGFQKGDFPGASNSFRGKLDLAHQGSLFLEEINSLTLENQNQLVQYSKKNDFDLRIIATSSKNLKEEVSKGLFHKELFNLLNNWKLKIPPLRDHTEDLPILISHFSDQIVREGGYFKKTFSEHAMQTMKDYFWPGNVRELRNFLERIYILTPTDFVDVHDIRFAGITLKTSENTNPSEDGLAELSTFREARAQFEKEYLVKKLSENNGNISRTAEIIGLERSYLHRKIKSYGIDSQSSETTNSNKPIELTYKE